MTDLVDLETFDTAELRVIVEQAEAEIKRRSKAERAEFMTEVKRMAKERGIDPADLLGAGTGANGKPKPPAKYANPSDPSQTWSGRGRAPAWAAGYKARGELAAIAI